MKVQKPLAAKTLNADAWLHIHPDVASLMLSTMPLTGNYREVHYKDLVDQAIDVVATKLLNRPPSNTSMLAHATCCNSWGEKRTIEAHNHPPWKIVPLTRKGKKQIKTKEALKLAILGKEPEDPAEPWMVDFPKAMTKCSYNTHRNYRLRIEPVQDPHEDNEQLKDDDAGLGKRSEDDLPPLEEDGKQQQEGRP